MAIFNSYVSLPEGNFYDDFGKCQWDVDGKNVNNHQ